MNMINQGKTLFALVAATCIALAPQASAQTDDAEKLKLAALEALISAPPERALPLAVKALQGNHSDEVKSRALFVLSQIELPEAQNVVMDTARQGSGETQVEAIRMVGIAGDVVALSQLVEVYEVGDVDVREAVLEAYVIADDKDAVYELAVRVSNSGNEEDF
jgi:HEAT repeat protein